MDGEFDMILAEHRARRVEKDLGLDQKRKGKECYQTGSPFMIEMNLHNASVPLMNLVDKIERNLVKESDKKGGYKAGSP